MSAEVIQFPRRRRVVASATKQRRVVVPMPERYVSKREVKDFLGRSERWIELRMKDAGLPFYREPNGRSVSFRLSEIDAWRKRWARRNG